MKINIGGQKGRAKGPFKKWTIVDTRDGAEVKIDIMKDKLPMADGSVDAIYTSHTLEHIFSDRVPFVLKQCHRVLKPGCPFRIVVPDIDKAIQAYIKGDSSYLSDGRNPLKQKYLPSMDICYLQSWFFTFREEKKKNKRLVGGHVMAYNFALMKHYLKDRGFRNIRELGFNECHPDFKGCDFKRYRDCSLYVECEK